MERMRVVPAARGSYERAFPPDRRPRLRLHLREPNRRAVRDELSKPRLERAIGVVYRPDTEMQSHYFWRPAAPIRRVHLVRRDARRARARGSHRAERRSPGHLSVRRVRRTRRRALVGARLIVDCRRGSRSREFVEPPLRIKQRAGHRSFSTTEYIREAENLTRGFGDPFPPLPLGVTKGFGLVSAFWAGNTPKKPGESVEQRGIECLESTNRRNFPAKSTV